MLKSHINGGNGEAKVMAMATSFRGNQWGKKKETLIKENFNFQRMIGEIHPKKNTHKLQKRNEMK